MCLVIAAQEPANLPEAITNGIQLAKQGKYLEAEQVLKTFAEKNPGKAVPQAVLGELYYHFGYYAAALPVLQKAYALEPKDRRSQVLAAVCLFKTGDGEKAQVATKSLLEETPPPNDVDLTLTYAQYLFEKGELDRALAQVRAATVFAPQHPIAFFWLARVLQAKGQRVEAAAAAEHSVALAPQLPFAHNLLVRLYGMQGRTADAAREADWMKAFDARKTGQ